MHKRKQSKNKENQENSGPAEIKRNKYVDFISTSKNNILKPNQENIISKESNEKFKNDYNNHKSNIEKSNFDSCEPISKQINEKITEDAQIGYSEEVNYENNLKQIKTIKEILSHVNSSGNCSVGGEASELPTMLGLHVKNIGHISLPLTEQQAQELIKVCKEVSYGLEYETLCDKTVRDTHQLEPTEIEIKNKEWNESLDKLVQKVAKEMGCMGCKVQAKLNKMLLHKKGDHFQKHIDTEKEKGTFANLIVQLPSIYTGGELNVYSYRDSIKTYDFGQSTGKTEYAIHYVAHYADLEHEMQEVKSGFRLVLIYNLIWSNENGISLNNEYLVERMKEALNILNESPVPLAMFLDHKYTQRAIKTNGLKALKGIDNKRYSLLKQASDKLSANKKSNFYLICGSLLICADNRLADSFEYRTNGTPDDSENDDSDEDEDDDDDRYFSTDEEEDEDEDGGRESIDLTKTSKSEQRKMLLFLKNLADLEGNDDYTALNKLLSTLGMDKYDKPDENEDDGEDDDDDECYDFFGATIDKRFDKFIAEQFKKQSIIKKSNLTNQNEQVKNSQEKIDVEKYENLKENQINDINLNDSRSNSDSCDSNCDCNSEDTDNQEDELKKKNVWEVSFIELDVNEFYDFSNKISEKEQLSIAEELDFDSFADIIDPNCKDFDEKIDLKNRKLWARHVNVEKSRSDEGTTKSTLYKKYLLVFWPNMNEFETLAMVGYKVALTNLLEKINKTPIANDKTFLTEFKYLLDSMRQSRDREKLSYVDLKTANEIMLILSLVKDLNLTQLFIGKIMTQLFEENCKPLSGLIKLFGYDKLNDSMKSLLLPISSLGFESSCKLIKILIEENRKEDAFSFFKNCLRLVMHDDESLKILAENKGYYGKESHFFALAKVIFLFQDHVEFELISKEYYDSVIKILDSKDFQSLLDDSVKYIPYCKNPKLIKDLFRYRVEWLKKELKKKPVFSWHMPDAEFPDHKVVKDFLRSNEEKMYYTGVFDSNNTAKDFVNKYKYKFQPKKTYSVNMGYKGKGKDGKVRLTKTKSYFNEIMNVYKGYEYDLDKINKLNLDL